MEGTVRRSLEEARGVLDDLLADEERFRSIERAGTMLARTLREGGKVIACGNGGSMCDAMHFAEELTGRFRENRQALPAVAISDPAYLTCTANDYGFEQVFARFVEAHGKRGDVLLAISTSGNSPNVIEAARAARERGMSVIGLTGKTGGELAAHCDVNILVPWHGYADRVQEVHIKIIHILIEQVEASLR
jgi:D-sedoheptulose 7-phosphate isomerase